MFFVPLSVYFRLIFAASLLATRKLRFEGSLHRVNTLLVYTPHELQASVYDIPHSGTLAPESELRSVHSSLSKLPLLTLGRLYYSWVLFLRQTLAKNNRLYILIKTSFSAFVCLVGFVLKSCYHELAYCRIEVLVAKVHLLNWANLFLCWTGPTFFSAELGQPFSLLNWANLFLCWTGPTFFSAELGQPFSLLNWANLFLCWTGPTFFSAELGQPFSLLNWANLFFCWTGPTFFSAELGQPFSLLNWANLFLCWTGPTFFSHVSSSLQDSL